MWQEAFKENLDFSISIIGPFIAIDPSLCVINTFALIYVSLRKRHQACGHRASLRSGHCSVIATGSHDIHNRQADVGGVTEIPRTHCISHCCWCSLWFFSAVFFQSLILQWIVCLKNNNNKEKKKKTTGQRQNFPCSSTGQDALPTRPISPVCCPDAVIWYSRRFSWKHAALHILIFTSQGNGVFKNYMAGSQTLLTIRTMSMEKSSLSTQD